jgi:hypothetical protein
MRDPGRPTLYRPDYCDLARNYCLLGATNEHLGFFFEVTSRTIDNWIAQHPAFAAAVHEGRAIADAGVARGLYQRAIGHEHKVERTVWHLGKERPVSDTLYYPPDVRACIFWLRNRQPRLWSGRDRPLADDQDDPFAALDAACEPARGAVPEELPRSQIGSRVDPAAGNRG